MRENSQNSDTIDKESNSDEIICDIDSIFKDILDEQANGLLENIKHRNNSSSLERGKRKEQEHTVIPKDSSENRKNDLYTKEGYLSSDLIGKSLRSSLNVSKCQNMDIKREECAPTQSKSTEQNKISSSGDTEIIYRTDLYENNKITAVNNYNERNLQNRPLQKEYKPVYPLEPHSDQDITNINSESSLNTCSDLSVRTTEIPQRHSHGMEKAIKNGQRPRTVSKFIFSLYELVNSRKHPSLDWYSHDSFIIHDKNTFEQHSLPFLSKTNEFSGFVRQLNGYGFKKLPGKKMIYKNEWFTREGKDLFRMRRVNKKPNTYYNQHIDSHKLTHPGPLYLTNKASTLIPSSFGRNLSFLDNIARDGNIDGYPNSLHSRLNENDIHKYLDRLDGLKNSINYNSEHLDSKQLLLPEIDHSDRYGQIEKYNPLNIGHPHTNTHVNTQLARLQLQIDAQQAKIEQLTSLVKDLILGQGNFPKHSNYEEKGRNIFSLGSNISDNKLLEGEKSSSVTASHQNRKSHKGLLSNKNYTKKKNENGEIDKYLGDYF